MVHYKEIESRVESCHENHHKFILCFQKITAHLEFWVGAFIFSLVVHYIQHYDVMEGKSVKYRKFRVGFVSSK